MKIVRVQNIRSDAREKFEYADVIVECGHLWWKREKALAIFRDTNSPFWRFFATGEYTPGYQVDGLILAARARKEMP